MCSSRRLGSARRTFPPWHRGIHRRWLLVPLLVPTLVAARREAPKCHVPASCSQRSQSSLAESPPPAMLGRQQRPGPVCQRLQRLEWLAEPAWCAPFVHANGGHKSRLAVPRSPESSQRHLLAQSGGQVNLVFLFVHENLPYLFGHRELAQRLALTYAVPIMAHRLDFVFEVETQHFLRIV